MLIFVANGSSPIVAMCETNTYGGKAGGKCCVAALPPGLRFARRSRVIAWPARSSRAVRGRAHDATMSVACRARSRAWAESGAVPRAHTQRCQAGSLPRTAGRAAVEYACTLAGSHLGE